MKTAPWDKDIYHSPELEGLYNETRISKTAKKAIYDKYMTVAYTTVKSNPYRLIDDIYGVGFIIADAIAKNSGIEHLSPLRIKSGIHYLMKHAIVSMGHTCLPFNDLVSEARQVLRVELDPIIDTVEGMLKSSELIQVGNMIYDESLYKTERYIADKLLSLLEGGDNTSPDFNEEGLAKDQVQAVLKATHNNVFILTGAPGTGKTYTIKYIMDLFKGQDIRLAAPTGKAAKRMNEQTGHEAETIHRLLGPMYDRVNRKFYFEYGEDCPLTADVVILDEVSMVDIKLFESLLRALPDTTRLIMVGDTYQLPPVGAGYVLRDMIASGVIPCEELTIIKRQDPGLIIENCHAIKNGRINLKYSDDLDSDFSFIELNDINEIKERIHAVLRWTKIAEYDILRDIQVITPLRVKTDLGCNLLNPYLQDKLNPEPPISIGKKGNIYQFRKGDKVIQTKNDYKNKILNGDIGYVMKIDNSYRKEITVKFEAPFRTVKLPMFDNKLTLAYAITCHKFQGSENKVIIIPIHKCFGNLIMQRNWLYTAISRASELCIVIGDKEQIPIIINRNQQIKRFTNLEAFLKDDK